MKNLLKSSLSLLLVGAVLMALPLTSCKKINQDDNNVSSQETSSTVSEAEVPDAHLNPLTGLSDLTDGRINKRPVTIMINNAPKAWPQKGISKADVVYELPVEGGATRLLAMFSDYTDVEQFGSLRSVRHDFVELALPFNPVFIHWGGSEYGYNAIKDNKVDNIDGMKYGNKFFYTDEALRKSRNLEHCRFMKQDQLTKALEELNLNQDTTPIPAYKFNKAETPITFADTMASKITAKVSGEVTTIFTYDPATQKYGKQEFGKPQKDGNTDTPVAIDNVFILFAEVTLMPTNIHKDIHLTNGTGYYISNGTKTKINWSKGNPSAPMKYTNEAGQELTVNAGNSWVLFTPKETQANVTFE